MRLNDTIRAYRDGESIQVDLAGKRVQLEICSAAPPRRVLSVVDAEVLDPTTGAVVVMIPHSQWLPRVVASWLIDGERTPSFNLTDSFGPIR